MLIPEYKSTFKKDLAKMQRRNKDITKLITVMSMLINGVSLPSNFDDHSLKGEYIGHRDCHIEPDWVLIYRVGKSHIEFVRTGTHSDLF
jgi:mRNA interferase YafQ